MASIDSAGSIRRGEQHLLPAEGEQLPGEARRAFGRLLDLLELEAHGAVAVVQLVEREAGEAEDRRQQVVEVVRDAAGQPADRLHLLRLLQLPLDGLARLALFARLPPQLGVAELAVDRRAPAAPDCS